MRDGQRPWRRAAATGRCASRKPRTLQSIHSAQQKARRADSGARDCSDSPQEWKEAPLGEKVERGEHEAKLEKPLAHVEPERPPLFGGALSLLCVRISFDGYCFILVAITVAQIALHELAHVIALGAKRSSQPRSDVQ